MDRQEYVPVKGETHEDISFERMVQGLVDFTQSFPGKVWLEVLLLAGGRSFYTHTRSGNGEGKS
jgi:wyosine [tRNA(Phe)-imidazoG37] synthetase (radical SAM superfamily)